MANVELGGGPLERMDAMQLDENGADSTAFHPPLQLSEKERQILELYDRLEEIKLETSLLQAQETIPDDGRLSIRLSFLMAQNGLILYRAV